MENKKIDGIMLQTLKNQGIFANPLTLRFGMETIILSYEPGSDFAVALEELIRNSAGVQVVKSGVEAKAVLGEIQDLFVDDKGWDSEEQMLEELAKFRQERIA